MSDVKLTKSAMESNEKATIALRYIYGKNTKVTPTTDPFSPYDLIVNFQGIEGDKKVEVKYRKHYTMAELLSFDGGICCELNKVNNQENEFTTYLTITLDGYAAFCPLREYTSTGPSPKHKNKTETDTQTYDVVSDWAYYDELDEIWLIPELHSQYLKDVDDYNKQYESEGLRIDYQSPDEILEAKHYIKLNQCDEDRIFWMRESLYKLLQD